MKSHLAGDWRAAETVYERIVAEAPDDFQANNLLGSLRLLQGRPREAFVRLAKARRLQPLSAPTTMCLGIALGALGRHNEAEKTLRVAVALDPKSYEAWANLGGQYLAMGRQQEAVGCYGRALKCNPGYAAGWTGLGTAFLFMGRGGAAVTCHTRALELDPRQPRARFARAQAWQACQCVDEALADFDAHLAMRPDHHEARSFRLFLLNYRADLSREEIFAEHLKYGKAVEQSIVPKPLDSISTALSAEASAKADPGVVAAVGRAFAKASALERRLRVAFLSPDFRTHSVAFFIEPLIAHLARSQFEVVLYHDHFCVDRVTERLRGRADLWRHFAGMAPGVVEEAIRADAPDILVDLAGHTGFNRLELFARRLAPVQVSYLGYPNTTGLAAMDYRFTDPVADPAGEADRFHTERLVRFAPAAWAYAPPAEAPAPEPGPSERGDPLTFGSFNALSKLNLATLRLWRDVLAAVPDARLVIKCASDAPESWPRRLEEAGIAAERVRVLRPSPGIAAHLAAYAQMDIALDPFPYNGTTTTCEALWMSVPVVTMAGDRHAARVGASLLTAVGHEGWIARSPAEYVRIAAELAAARDLRRELRTGLREAMRRSALLDHAGQARRFGDALRECWEKRVEVPEENFSKPRAA